MAIISKTKARVEMLQHLLKNKPMTRDVFRKSMGKTHHGNFNKAISQLENVGFVMRDQDDAYFVTVKAVKTWAKELKPYTRSFVASENAEKQNTSNAEPKVVKSLAEIGQYMPSTTASPALQQSHVPAKPPEQTPGGVDLGVEAVEAAIRSRIEAEMRDKFRRKIRATYRLPFTIGGKTTSAYTIDETLAACTAYMQAVNELLSDI